MKTYTNEEIYEQLLVPSILERFRVTKDDIKPETTFVDDLGLDSLDLADLACEIEERYGAELVNNEKPATVKIYQTACMGTLNDMVEAIQHLIEWEQTGIIPDEYQCTEEDLVKLKLDNMIMSEEVKEKVLADMKERKDDSKVS